MVCPATSDAVFACGLNNYGQLGFDPDAHNQLDILTSIVGLEGKSIVDVQCGEHYSMAVDRSGQLYAFGRADQHQLGYEFNDEGAGQFFWKPKLVGGRLQEARRCSWMRFLALRRNYSKRRAVHVGLWRNAAAWAWK